MQSNQITKQVTLSTGRISGNNKLTVELKDECMMVKEEGGVEDCGFKYLGWGGVLGRACESRLAHARTPAVFGILCAVRVKVLRRANPR